MPFVSSRGSRIHYQVLGEGAPVLLIHGFTNFGMVWAEQAVPLVYAGYKVILPDLAGHGLSTPASVKVTVADLAADMVHLLDALGIERALIGGLSLGGMVVQEMAIEYPARVAAAVIADSSADANTPKNVALVDEWVSLFKQPDGQLLRQQQAWPALVQEDYRNSPAGVAFFETWRSILKNVPGSSLACVASALAEFTASQRLARVTAPCLVVNGEFDRLFALDVCRKIAELIPKARFEIIRGGGHICSLDRPLEFNRLLLDFLAQHVNLVSARD